MVLRSAHRWVAVVVALALLAPGVTGARSGFSFPYALPVVFNTAVRLLRIDRGCQITERDAEAAYLLFECRDGKESKQVRRGALEVYALPGGVKGHLTLLDEPRYMEQRLLELLGQKLREERGDPPAVAPVPAPAPRPHPPDGGQG